MEPKELKPPIEVPEQALTDQALHGVIENFILRDGTDYGLQEISFENKEKQVRKQIKTGEVKIVFDPNTESVSLLTKEDWKKRVELLKS